LQELIYKEDLTEVEAGYAMAKNIREWGLAATMDEPYQSGNFQQHLANLAAENTSAAAVQSVSPIAPQTIEQQKKSGWLNKL
jgi:hypothetical protein